MKILFANIGNRNLIVKGNYDWLDKDGFINKKVFKEKTKEILDNFDQWKDKLKVNILDVLGDLSKFDKVYLVGTDQGGQNDNQDTIYAAEIIKKLLSLDNINILQFNTDPTDRKAALYYYKKVFKQRVGKEDLLYIFVSGGVPAMKEAMVWAVLSEDLNVRIIEAINGNLEESKVEEVYLKEIYKKSLKLFIKNYDWFGAEKLIEKNKRLFGNKIDFLYKLQYTNARFNFDFNTANKLVDEMELSLKEEDIFKKIDIKTDEEGIKELLNNIKITYKKGEYTMLLGKIFRLQEALYRYIFEKITGISTEKDENGKFDIFINYIEGYEDLKDYLQSNDVKYDMPNTYVLLKILSFFKENDVFNDKNKFKDLFLLFGLASSIDKLKSVRNLSIMAHGWQGISKEDLDDQKFNEKIDKIREVLGLSNNIFDIINESLLEEVDNL